MAINIKFSYKNSAFTIVELLVVIVVIGILAAITVVSYSGISQKASVSSLKSDLSSAKKQLVLYQVEHGAFPTSVPNTTGNTYCPVDDTKYCFKASTDTTFTYSYNNSNATPTFNLLATKGSTNYNVTNSSQPSVFTAIPEASVSATGTYTLSTDDRYRIYKFTGNGTITTTAPGTAEVLVVGGGGGGGEGGNFGGGGGAGQVVINTNYNLTGSVTATIGVGGGRLTSGNISIFGSITANGGGAGLGSVGGGTSGNGYSGGTGGNDPPKVGGGGGGGSSSNGVTVLSDNLGNGGYGGNGTYISISGSMVNYGGGGGGSGPSNGGIGQASGGSGGKNLSGFLNGGSATANSGSGGGGAVNAIGGSGGSGIVIIRYLTP